MDKKVGQERKTLQGMTTKVVQYIDDDKVLVFIKETNQRVWSDWKTFKKGLIRTNITHSHIHSESECANKRNRIKAIVEKAIRTRIYALGVTVLSIALIIALVLVAACK